MKTESRPPTPWRIPRRLVTRKTLHAHAASAEEFDDYDAGSEPNMKLSHAFIVVLILHVLAIGGVLAFNTLKTKAVPGDEVAKSQAGARPKFSQNHVALRPTVKAPAAPKVAAPVVEQTKALSAGVTHTVGAGDTLRQIAAHHKISVESLEQANDITTASTIRVGQVLRIPAVTAGVQKVAGSAPAIAKAPVAKPGVPVPVARTKAPQDVAAKPAVARASAPAAQSAPAPQSVSSGGTYLVVKGDNPYSIAKKLKVSYNELVKANKIEDPKKLQIGQKLIIP